MILFINFGVKSFIFHKLRACRDGGARCRNWTRNGSETSFIILEPHAVMVSRLFFVAGGKSCAFERYSSALLLPDFAG